MAEKKEQKLSTNRVFHILQHLDQQEIKRLDRFMRSPYFNQSKTLLQLCSLMVAQVEKGKEGFSKEKVWKNMFPDEPYNDTNFRKHSSDLMRLLEQFMAQEMRSADTERQQFDLLDFLAKRKIHPLLENTLNSIVDDFEDPKVYKNMEYFRRRYELERKIFAIRDFEVKQNEDPNLQAISDNLDAFYLIAKLKLLSTALIMRKMTSQHQEVRFAEQVVQSAQSFDFNIFPELAACWYAYSMITDEDNVEYFNSFREILIEFGHKMSKKEALELFDSALNYCTGKVNKGNNEFLKEYCDLSDYGLQHAIFIVNDELAARRYNNIVASSLRLGRMDWAENFVKTYKNYLPESSRQNSYTFNLARVYRFQKKWHDVIKLLRDVEYEDVFYNLISKATLTITYYELDEYDALESHLDAFRAFLFRQKSISDQLKQTYLNLIKNVKRLMRLSSTDKPAIAKLKEEITLERATIVNHEWLIEKLEELS